ncbi:MAG: zinc-binding dehydrogenase [Thermoplasmatota archaeon]
MKAAFFREHGGLDVLEYGELPDPEPAEGWVRVRVKACALNRLDVFVREGWPGLRLDLPHVGGTDLSGVVDKLGPGVNGVAIGDEVMVNPGLNFEADADGEQIIPPHPDIIGETRAGGLAEYCLVPANRVLPKPAGLSWEDAAALPLTCQTAMQMLRKGRVGPGSRVLIVGAGGGVSVIAVQLAKALGAWVAVTAGGPEKTALAKELGADLAIDYKADADWWKTAFKATNKEAFDVVIDSVGARTFGLSLRTLRNGGRLVTCGATTGPIAETNIQLVFWKQLQILGSTMGTPEDLQRALAFVADGKVRPIVDSVRPLSEIREAQARMESGEATGKIVLVP